MRYKGPRKGISSRNTSFSIHVLNQKRFSCIDIVSQVFFFDIPLHGILWLYKHHDDSPRQNVLVGVPCGPSSFNLANVECVAKMSKITSCIVKSATSRHCTTVQ